MEPFWEVMRVDTDCAEGRTRVLDVVVRVRRVDKFEGSSLDSLSVRSDIVDVEGTGRERVDGNERPGKEVRRTLIVDDAMVAVDRFVVLSETSYREAE